MNVAYTFNPDCGCSWCRNGGTPPRGYIAQSIIGHGRVYQGDDSCGNPHMPPSLRTSKETNAAP